MKNTRIKLKQPERDQAEQALKDYMSQGGRGSKTRQVGLHGAIQVQEVRTLPLRTPI